MGQLFYSMSLAMGIMITYGSYMKKEVSIEKSVRQIELFDTGIDNSFKVSNAKLMLKREKLFKNLI